MTSATVRSEEKGTLTAINSKAATLTALLAPSSPSLPPSLHVAGMAAQFSIPLLGKPLEGIWNTGIVCYGKEFYFGAGITADNPGQTPFGNPTEVVELGRTHVPVREGSSLAQPIQP